MGTPMHRKIGFVKMEHEAQVIPRVRDPLCNIPMKLKLHDALVGPIPTFETNFDSNSNGRLAEKSRV